MVQLAHCRYMFPYFNSEPDVWRLVTSITLVSPLLPAYSCFNPLWFVCFLFVCLFVFLLLLFFLFFFLLLLFFFFFFFYSFVCLFVVVFLLLLLLLFFFFVFFLLLLFFPQKISFGQKKIRKCTIHLFCDIVCLSSITAIACTQIHHFDQAPRQDFSHRGKVPLAEANRIARTINIR